MLTNALFSEVKANDKAAVIMFTVLKSKSIKYINALYDETCMKWERVWH